MVKYPKISLLISLFSGFITAFTLPTAWRGILLPNLGWLAWVSLTPLYLVLKKSKLHSAFWNTIFFGLAYFGVTTYYFYFSLYFYGRVSLAGSLSLSFLLVFLLSVFLALFSVLAVQISRKGVPLWISLPLAWVAYDFFRNYWIFNGCPGSGLAYTQSGFITLLQVLDITGIYGITFLLVLSNCFWGELWLWTKRQSAFPFRLSLVVVLLFVATVSYGFFRKKEIQNHMEAGPKFKIAVVQSNIPRYEKWTTALMFETWQKDLAISRQLETSNPDLVIWPETPNIAAIGSGRNFEAKLSTLKTPLLLGVLSYAGKIPDHWPPTIDDQKKGFSLFNSALLIEPGGKITGEYRKTHLVPFGEYIPLSGIFKNLRSVVSGTDFSSGKELNLLRVTNPKDSSFINIGVTICFEDLFPEIARSFTRKGANILVNLSNDAWFNRTSGIYQHLDYSRYRAIENRRSLARATNTGITALFSPTGEILSSAPPLQETSLVGAVPTAKSITFYTRFGDLFAVLSTILFILLFLKSFLSGAKSKG